MKRTRQSLLIILLGMLGPAFSAEASEGLFPTRYVACRRDAREVSTDASKKPVTTDERPVPRRRPPPKLSLSQLVVDDVAVAEPIPTVLPPPLEERVSRKGVEGQNDYLCIGLTRGRNGIDRVLEAPPNSAWAGHANDSRWPLRNMRAAGVFDLKETIPLIRRELSRPLPEKVDYRLFERLDAKLSAMRALADLGDAASAPRMLSFLEDREAKPISSRWKDALESLQRLDPKMAQAYALALIERSLAKAGGPVDDENARDRSSRIHSVLPLFTSPDKASVVALSHLSTLLETNTSDLGWHESCLLLAARIRVGDAALEKDLRAELSRDLVTQRGVMCYGDVIEAAFPGNDPDELDALFLRQRYPQLLNLLRVMQSKEASGIQDARFEPARQKLRGWLVKRSSEPDIAAGPDDNRFQPAKRAMHLTLLARLGDAKAQRDLFALIDDPKEEGIAPWVGAYHAMRLGIAGARDHAATRLGLSMTRLTQRFSTEPFPERGDLSVTDHGLVVDELALEGDPRFVLGLLDRERFTRELTAGQLARHPSPGACDLVASAAKSADEEAVQDAFWALSVLGDSCKPQMERLVSTPSEPETVRGMAAELLAMMRAPAAKTAIHKPASGTYRAALERAQLILDSRE